MATPPPMPQTRDRIGAGVAAGIISADQALALRQLPLDSGPERFSTVASGDEPFALFRGFRDVFLAIGIIILALGLAGVAGEIFGLRFDLRVGWDDVAMTAVMALIAWAVAEWVTRKLRMPLASLVLAVTFSGAFMAMLAAAIERSQVIPTSVVALNTLAPALFALGGLLFYVRFRLPAALFLVAAGLTLNVFQIISSAMLGAPNALALQIFAGASGFVIFCAALIYELKDPKRETRMAENAFWLHLIAAPLIVFALTGGLNEVAIQATSSAVWVFAIVFVLGLLALLIDRRAFIVSALLYLAGAIAYTISQSGVAPDTQFAITALVLGLFVVGLALGWQPMRRAFLSVLPESLSARLPNPVGPDALGG